MTTSFSTQWIAALLAASLVTMPAAAAPQAQQQAPASQQPAPTDPSVSGQEPASDKPSPDQPQVTDQQQSTPKPAAAKPVAQQQNPKVRPGSDSDVDAIGNRKVGHGWDMYSIEHDIAEGKAYAQQLDKVAKFIDDPVINEYVNRVTQNLVRNSDAQVPFTVKVIDGAEVNAFALPGGFMYVYSGLILHADEESELAGVLSHEIAHVCARHATRDETKRTITQLASIPAMIFIPYSWAGYAIYQGMNFGIPITFLKFSRGYEREADYLGLQYMYKAGYDPNSFVTFFEKVQAEERKQPGTIPKVFADHPPTPDRIEAIQKEIATILPTRDEYIVSTSEFDSVKTRLQMIEANVKVKNNNPNKPTLRKRTSQNKGGNPSADGGSTSAGGDTTSTSSTDQSSDSDRPTLKRRPDDQQQQQP